MGAVQTAGRNQCIFNHPFPAAVFHIIWPGACSQRILRRVDILRGVKRRRTVCLRYPFLFHQKRPPAICHAYLTVDPDGNVHHINFSRGTYHLFAAHSIIEIDGGIFMLNHVVLLKFKSGVSDTDFENWNFTIFIQEKNARLD